ncbi:hypothetical protein Agub_g4297, partial [Astrephomene gubernaculifera]
MQRNIKGYTRQLQPQQPSRNEEPTATKSNGGRGSSLLNLLGHNRTRKPSTETAATADEGRAPRAPAEGAPTTGSISHTILRIVDVISRKQDQPPGPQHPTRPESQPQPTPPANLQRLQCPQPQPQPQFHQYSRQDAHRNQADENHPAAVRQPSWEQPPPGQPGRPYNHQPPQNQHFHQGGQQQQCQKQQHYQQGGRQQRCQQQDAQPRRGEAYQQPLQQRQQHPQQEYRQQQLSRPPGSASLGHPFHDPQQCPPSSDYQHVHQRHPPQLPQQQQQLPHYHQTNHQHPYHCHQQHQGSWYQQPPPPPNVPRSTAQPWPSRHSAAPSNAPSTSSSSLQPYSGAKHAPAAHTAYSRGGGGGGDPAADDDDGTVLVLGEGSKRAAAKRAGLDGERLRELRAVRARLAGPGGGGERRFNHWDDGGGSW